LSAPTHLNTARNCGSPHWLRLPLPVLGASGCPAGSSPALCRTGRPLLGATTRRPGSRPPFFFPRVLRTFRASPARSNSPRGGFPQRQVLASASPEVFSPSAFSAAPRYPALPQARRSRFSDSVDPVAVLAGWSTPLLRFFARANGGFPSRLRRSDPDHAPSISCAAVFRYPAERSRNLAGFFNPATLLGFNTLRSFTPVRGSDRLLASCAHLPFLEHPTPIIWSGGQSLQFHTHYVCDWPRALAAAPGFCPRRQAVPPDLAPDGTILPWACASLRSSDTGNTGMPARHFSVRRSASHGHRFRHPDAHGFCWRCRCAATATKSDAPSGTHQMGASPADPSAFVAGA